MKNMFRLAKDIKIFSRRVFLQSIVEEAFDLSAKELSVQDALGT